jgi:hypothetical protein
LKNLFKETKIALILVNYIEAAILNNFKDKKGNLVITLNMDAKNE